MNRISRRRFLQIVSAGAACGASTGGLFGLAEAYAAPVYPAAPERSSGWRRLSDAPLVQRIVDDLYRREEIAGDVATTDYALFDLGARDGARPRRRQFGPALNQERKTVEAATPALALRETRDGRALTRLALYDGHPPIDGEDASPGAWRLGPSVGSDLTIVRAPLEARDPLAPSLPATWFAVLDRSVEPPRLWTIAAARAFAPIGARRLDPATARPATEAESDRLRAAFSSARAGASLNRSGVVRLAFPNPSGGLLALCARIDDMSGWLTPAGLFVTRGETMIGAEQDIFALRPGSAFPARRLDVV